MNGTGPDAPPVLFLKGASNLPPGEVHRLDEEESRHARALRLSEGAEVGLVDGRGVLRLGTLGPAADPRRCVVLGATIQAPASLPVELAVGIANRTHTLWLVEKATEFGVRRIVPVETRRSRSVADAGRSPSFWSKARRRALSALKQSGGAWLPEIDPVVGLDDWLCREVDAFRVLLDAGGPPLSSVLEGWNGRSLLLLLVGPEGGLTDDEMAACRGAGLHAAALGPTTLRFETAAIAALAVATQRSQMVGGDRAESGEGDRK